MASKLNKLGPFLVIGTMVSMSAVFAWQSSGVSISPVDTTTQGQSLEEEVASFDALQESLDYARTASRIRTKHNFCSRIESRVLSIRNDLYIDYDEQGYEANPSVRANYLTQMVRYRECVIEMSGESKRYKK